MMAIRDDRHMDHVHSTYHVIIPLFALVLGGTVTALQLYNCGNTERPLYAYALSTI